MQSTSLGLVIVFGLIAGSIVTLIVMMPPLDYLPDGNRNFVFGRILVPSGYTREATVNFAQSMEDVARPLWENPNPEKLPHIDRFFFVAYNGGAFAGARLSGAGASFPAKIYTRWFSDLAKIGGPRVNYQALAPNQEQ